MIKNGGGEDQIFTSPVLLPRPSSPRPRPEILEGPASAAASSSRSSSESQKCSWSNSCTVVRTHSFLELRSTPSCWSIQYISQTGDCGVYYFTSTSSLARVLMVRIFSSPSSSDSAFQEFCIILSIQSRIAASSTAIKWSNIVFIRASKKKGGPRRDVIGWMNRKERTDGGRGSGAIIITLYLQLRNNTDQQLFSSNSKYFRITRIMNGQKKKKPE